MNHEHLGEFLAEQRWFAGKGRIHTVTDVRRLAELSERLSIELVTVTFDDTSTELYQLPVAHYADAEDRLAHALIEEDEQGWHYDALHDREAMAELRHGWSGSHPRRSSTDPGRSSTAETLTFHHAAPHEIDPEAHSTLFSGEQSNSSVAFGEDAVLKVFRKLTPGINPDIELLGVLTEAEDPHIAALYGWLESTDGEVLQLAMLQQFLRTGTDGWELGLASVRNLFSEADLHAEEVGGDFAGEAHRLGMAVAEVHGHLREYLPEQTSDQPTAADLIEVMHGRLEGALVDVPELAAHAASLQELYDACASTDVISLQRIHGDLHLGQTLRTSLGWKLVDFEGEPARPLAERRLPDLVWRDVAGMLRSFDYAAQVVRNDFGQTAEYDAQLDYRAGEWLSRNRDAFLAGYLGDRSLSADEQTWLAALEADKAVYEVAYEARNRPAWVGIPLRAIQRLTTTAPR